MSVLTLPSGKEMMTYSGSMNMYTCSCEHVHVCMFMWVCEARRQTLGSDLRHHPHFNSRQGFSLGWKSPHGLGWPMKPQVSTSMPGFKVRHSSLRSKHFTNYTNFPAFFSCGFFFLFFSFLFFLFYWPTLGLIQWPTSSSWRRKLLVSGLFIVITLETRRRQNRDLV